VYVKFYFIVACLYGATVIGVFAGFLGYEISNLAEKTEQKWNNEMS